ncbi:MAG: hypothetical protein DMF93_25215, partial [Acidobacteria bacterium]
MSALKGQSGQASGSRSASRFRTSLATAQIALSMALLVSAGLFTKSLFNVSRVDLGLHAENVLMFGISPELNGYKPEQSRQLFERLEDELGALPGVTSVTMATVPLLSGNNWGNNVAVEGFEAGPDTDMNARFNLVGPQYFQTLGMTMIAGREFTRGDVLSQPRIAIVNEAFAKKFNLGRDAIGKHMSDQGFDGKKDIEIVGLVQNAKYSDVKREVPPQFFRPYRQDKNAGFRAAADAAPAGPPERVPRSVHQRAVRGVRVPRDAARGGRALRRARLHRLAAHARDRAADGARRGAFTRADDGAAAGGHDG